MLTWKSPFDHEHCHGTSLGTFDHHCLDGSAARFPSRHSLRRNLGWPAVVYDSVPSDRGRERTDVPSPSPAEAKERLEQALFEIRRVIARAGRHARARARLPARAGHLLIEGVPGLAKTLTIKTTAGVLGGTFARVQFTPDLVPVRPRRHAHLPARRGRVRHRARPGLLQLPARRRDQPRARQGAVGAARGHAGAPGHDRPHDATRCRTRSSSWRRRTRSSRRARTRCPRRRSTASCSRCSSTTRRTTRS